MKQPNEFEGMLEPPFYYDKEGQMVFDQRGLVVNVRMWGRLTGINAMNLPDNEAIRKQDAFGEQVAKLLNEWYDNGRKG